MIFDKVVLLSVGFLALFAVASCGPTPTKDCGSKHGSVVSITFDPAPVGQCSLPRGKNVTAIITLKIDEVTQSLNVKAKGDVVVWVPFPLPNDDACTQGVTCPTTPGSTYTFKTAIPISSTFPQIRLAIQMEFKDQNGDDAVCFQFPAEIC